MIAKFAIPSSLNLVSVQPIEEATAMPPAGHLKRQVYSLDFAMQNHSQPQLIGLFK